MPITMGDSAGGGGSSQQQAYTTAGTYSWTAPSGVTSVCVVCVCLLYTSDAADE